MVLKDASASSNAQCSCDAVPITAGMVLNVGSVGASWLPTWSLLHGHFTSGDEANVVFKTEFSNKN